MKAKRGQLTVFVIIGVVLIIGLGLFLYTRSGAAPKEEAVPADIAPVKMYIEECLKQTAEDAVLRVAFYGGYYQIPENSTDFNSMGIPYYYNEGRVLVPSKTKIQNEIADYVNENLGACIDFEALREKGYSIEAGEAVTTVEIAAEEVFFTLDYPLTIKVNEVENKLSKFDSTVKADIMKMRDASSEYITAQKEVPQATKLQHLIDISIKYGLFSNVLNLGDTILYYFTDNNVNIRGQPLVYTFSVYYPEEVLSGKPISISGIPEQTATIGKEFYLKIDAIGENLDYSAVTGLFNMSKTGEIRFTPGKEQVGSYTILLIVDDKENVEYATLKLTIKE